ncbi:molybdate ABC transporter substrate-binding protein [Kordiimonas laminariae]|uniref:molybdate ABC transporter substrate-binding protein n=1 Tax=Kordiimonas laminariae TaxID=2917717 RepID=UPI001FF4D723|nr:molybdate ABC transporter substrate-binding protein [Kordiimonas laminariae]MCK0068639.1 molybdate ABC transporter substrate-binding protein [Kordiimonas laminariae]
MFSIITNLLKIVLLFAAVFCVSFKATAKDTRQRSLIIFAASSTQDVLPEIARAFSQKTKNPKPLFSFGGSAILARQINAGAKADIIISAHEDWISYLQEKKQLKTNPTIIAANTLVIATSKSKTATIPHINKNNLLSLLKGGRLALANPATSPAGQYAKRFLLSIDAWDALKGKVAYSPNVRQTLRLVEYGGLTGFIYASDAAISTNVHIIHRVQNNPTENPIQYIAAPLKQSNSTATSFIAFLKSPNTAPIWEKYGFITIASN